MRVNPRPAIVLFTLCAVVLLAGCSIQNDPDFTGALHSADGFAFVSDSPTEDVPSPSGPGKAKSTLLLPAASKSFRLPEAPHGLVVTVPARLSGTIDLKWRQSGKADGGFDIERKSGTGAFALVNRAGPKVLSYRDTGLAGGITYTYRVRATNVAGKSAYSNETSAVPIAPAPPPPTSAFSDDFNRPDGALGSLWNYPYPAYPLAISEGRMTAGAVGFGYAAIAGMNFVNGTLDVDYDLTRLVFSNQKMSFVLRSDSKGVGLEFAVYCYSNGNCEAYLAAPSMTSAGQQNIRFGDTTRTLPVRSRYEGHLRITLRQGIVSYELEGLAVSAPVPSSVDSAGGIFVGVPMKTVPAAIFYDNLDIEKE